MLVLQNLYQIFLKISQPLGKLLSQDIPFIFDKKCTAVFITLKEKLTSACVVVSPDWNLPFELMCDASHYAVGEVLGQKVERLYHANYYSSLTLNEAQVNYTKTGKELLAVVFALDKSDLTLLAQKLSLKLTMQP